MPSCRRHHQTICNMPVLPKAEAEKFGKLCILYNNRICPVQTYALDFCKKIYGARRSYRGLTRQNKCCRDGYSMVKYWENEPFIKIKSGELKSSDAVCLIIALTEDFL